MPLCLRVSTGMYQQCSGHSKVKLINLFLQEFDHLFLHRQLRPDPWGRLGAHGPMVCLRTLEIPKGHGTNRNKAHAFVYQSSFHHVRNQWTSSKLLYIAEAILACLSHFDYLWS